MTTKKPAPDLSGAVPVPGKWLPELLVKADAPPPLPPSPTPQSAPVSGAMSPVQLFVTGL